MRNNRYTYLLHSKPAEDKDDASIEKIGGRTKQGSSLQNISRINSCGTIDSNDRRVLEPYRSTRISCKPPGLARGMGRSY